MANPTGAISTGEHEEKFGFERWTFFLSINAIQAAVEKGERMNDPGYIKEIPQRFWMQQNRVPTRCEIAEISIGKIDTSGRAEITVIIKRGHWVLAEIFSNHEGVSAYKADDFINVSCSCCTEGWTIPISSLPDR
jgi:hypothetical protein